MGRDTRTPPHSERSLKTIDFLVLAVLTEGPIHGYGLAQAIGERTDQRTTIRPGDLYRVLYRLANAGLIRAVPSGRSGDDEDRRQCYRLTRRGRRSAEEHARSLRQICDGVLEGSELKAGRSA